MGKKKKEEEVVQQNPPASTGTTQPSLNGTIAEKMGFSTETDSAGNTVVKYPQQLQGAADAIKTAVTTPTAATTGTTPTEPKPTIMDYLEERRKTLAKEKTDAAKMQRYYALTDALNAIGKMGATAIGGAIGGNVPDSAPIVGEYKESRGYLDAFERAKKANDKLQDIDNEYYKLALRDDERAYQKGLRDEAVARQEKAKADDRAYAEQQRAEQRAYEKEVREMERAYQKEQKEEDRKWQKTFAAYQNALTKAARKEDREAEAKLRKELADKENEFKKASELRKQNFEIKIAEIKNQGSGGKGGSNGGYETRTLKDGSDIVVPKATYEAMKGYFSGQMGGYIDDAELEQYIYENPQAVNDYLAPRGFVPPTPSSTPATTGTQTGSKTKEEVKSAIAGYKG